MKHASLAQATITLQILLALFSFAHAAPTATPDRNRDEIYFREGNISAYAEIPSKNGIKIIIKRDSKKNVISLPDDDVNQIREIFKKGDALIVVSGIKGYENFSAISAIRLSDLTWISSFYAYSAKWSPDRNNVAYVRFYPLHFTEGSEDQFFIANISHLLQQQIYEKAYSNHPGIRILTIPNQKRHSSNSGTDPQSASRLIETGFVWSPDGKSFAFLNAIGNLKTELVFVSLSEKFPAVNTYNIRKPLASNESFALDLLPNSTPRLNVVPNNAPLSTRVPDRDLLEPGRRIPQ